MKYAIFVDGLVLDDIITENLIAAAKRGKITTAGKKLMLVPDKRYGPPDVSGRRLWKRTKNSECIPLINLLPK